VGLCTALVVLMSRAPPRCGPHPSCASLSADTACYRKL
jgi:hypothetical protein